jgi:hypothetical protein
MVRLFVRHDVADYAVAASDRLRERMGEAGVQGRPQIWFVTEA